METTEARIEKFKELNLLKKGTNLWEKSGFQVIMCARNEASILPSVLFTIERSMRGLKWALIFGDDGSEDNTYEAMHAACARTNADFVKLNKYEKMENVSMVKNNLAKISKEYEEDYPGILFCDADDFIKRDKVKGLFSRAKEVNANMVIGDWIYSNMPLKKFEVKTAGESLHRKTFGPWNTLIHSSLIPEDGKFWNENIKAHADLLMWWELAAAGVDFEIANVLTAEYNAHYGSTSKSRDIREKKALWGAFEKEKAKVLEYSGLEDAQE